MADGGVRGVYFVFRRLPHNLHEREHNKRMSHRGKGGKIRQTPEKRAKAQRFDAARRLLFPTRFAALVSAAARFSRLLVASSSNLPADRPVMIC